MRLSSLSLCTALFIVLLSGCSTNPANQQVSSLEKELSTLKAQNQQLQSSIDQSNSGSNTAQSTGGGNALLPPNAKPGECYARVLIPATYKTTSKEALKSEASYKLKVSQPTYEWAEEQILVKGEFEVADIIPARYETRTESILVKDAHEHLKTVPATYSNETKRVLVKDAYTTWKKGRGPIEKLNNATGEIMCLVEIPAQYKTISTRVLATPARTEKNLIPAVYKDVTSTVMVEEPKLVKRTIPAKYKTVKVRKVAVPGQETRIEIPAVYQTVTETAKVTDEYLEWRNILCETNTTPDIVRRIQRALKTAGYNPGRIDGVIGSETLYATKRYQQDKKLAVGQLTLETLKSLGVRY